MSPTFYLFLVLVIFYYAIAHHLTLIQRKLQEIEGRVKESGKKLEKLSELDDLRENLRDLPRDLDLAGELRELQEGIRDDLKHEIEMHEIRTK